MGYIDSYGVEYSDDKKKLVRCPIALVGQYRLLPTTEVVGANAFKGCTSLTELTFPESLNKIESGAFFGVTKLKGVTYEGSLSQWLHIDWHCGIECSHSLTIGGDLLTHLVLPSDCTIIPAWSFYYCDSIKQVTFNSSLKQISSSAFNKSSLYGEIVFPEGLEEIKDYAFFSCSSIKSFFIPSSVKKIWYAAFSSCSTLSEFKVSPDNKNFVSDYFGLYSSIDKKLIAVSCGGRKREPYILPSWVKAIVKHTFCYTTYPHHGIVINHRLESVIDGAAFLKTDNLVIFTRPDLKEYLISIGIPKDILRIGFCFEDALLTGHNCINAVVYNPYRVLGCPVNSDLKTLTAASRKIIRFLEVGKQDTPPSELDSVLAPITLTKELVEESLNKLSTPDGRFKYGLFWLAEGEEVKKGAFHIGGLHLDTYTWLDTLNNVVRNLAKNNIDGAFDVLITACNSDGFIKTFCKELGLDDTVYTLNKMLSVYIDTLSEDLDIIDFGKLYASIATTNSKVISTFIRKRVLEECVSRVSMMISKANKIDPHDSVKSLEAAKTLKDDSSKIANILLNSYLEDTQAIVLLDKLSDRILQCAINYHNNSDDKYAAMTAVPFAEYALSLAQSQVRKDRCSENLEIMQGNAEGQIPVSIEQDLTKMESLLDSYKNLKDTLVVAHNLLTEAAPYIVGIKEYLNDLVGCEAIRKDVSNRLYTISSAIVNLALNKIVNVVNDEVHKSNGNVYATALLAWDVILNMEEFPMEDSFKTNRYLKNKSSLKDLIQKTSLFPSSKPTQLPLYPSKPINLLTDDEFWRKIKTISDCNSYLQIYPKGKHIEDVKAKLSALEANKERSLWTQSEISGNYLEYLSLYPHGIYSEEAKLRLKEKQDIEDDQLFSSCKSAYDYMQYLIQYPQGRHSNEAGNMRDNLSSLEKKEIDSCASKSDYEKYLEKYSYGIYQDKANAYLRKYNIERHILLWTIAAESAFILLFLLYQVADVFWFALTCAIVFILTFYAIIYFYSINPKKRKK